MTFGSIVVVGISLWLLFTLIGYAVVLLMILGVIGLMWITERRSKTPPDQPEDTL